MSCNLAYSIPNFIPIIAHNLSGYDSHFFIKKLCTQIEGRINILPYNKEKYKSFTKRIALENESDEENGKISFNLRFIDSFSFLPFKLSTLALGLREFKITNEMMSDFSNEQITLLLRKGVFPYDFITSLESLNSTKLPPKKDFFSRLSNEHISEEDYEHAQKVWHLFSCKTLGDYSDIYLKTDILLLADIFECFRNLCLETYELDAAYYITSPSLRWDAMLKIT